MIQDPGGMHSLTMSNINVGTSANRTNLWGYIWEQLEMIEYT